MRKMHGGGTRTAAATCVLVLDTWESSRRRAIHISQTCTRAPGSALHWHSQVL
jgi:hypothetical protein